MICKITFTSLKVYRFKQNNDDKSVGRRPTDNYRKLLAVVVELENAKQGLNCKFTSRPVAHRNLDVAV